MNRGDFLRLIPYNGQWVCYYFAIGGRLDQPTRFISTRTSPIAGIGAREMQKWKGWNNKFAWLASG